MTDTEHIEAARVVSGVRRSPEALSWATQVHVLKPVQRMLQEGDVSGAAEGLAALSRAHPHSSVFSCELAALLYASGQHGPAAARLEAFARNHPGDHRSRSYLGTMRALNGGFREALELLTAAVQCNTHDFFTQINYKYLVRRFGGGKKVQALTPVPFAIATSIPPRDIEESQQALASWRRLGAEVHSLNTAEEIELLKPHFDFVHFSQCEETAKERFGKNYQYLSNILAMLSGLECEVCAIFNSDIILDCELEDMAALVEAARRSLVFGSRLNVDAPDAPCGRVYERGFDFFFFPRALSGQIPKVDYCLGLHWWDYAFPWLAHRAGAELAFCYSPIARHVNHPARWNEQFFYDFGLYTAKIVAPELASLIEQSASGHIFADEFLCNMALSIYSSLVGMARPLHCDSEEMRNVFAPIDGSRVAIDILSTNLCVLDS